jgi:hypothetical protein
MGSGDAGAALWLVVVGPEGSPCAVSVWGETSDAAGDGDGSWVGLDDCCSGAAATLSLVEAGLAGASACTAPDVSVPWDVAVLSLVEAGPAGVSACTDPDPDPCEVEAS